MSRYLFAIQRITAVIATLVIGIALWFDRYSVREIHLNDHRDNYPIPAIPMDRDSNPRREPSAPIHWTPTNNVQWEFKTTECEIASHSVSGKLLFSVLKNRERNNAHTLYCVDLDRGNVLWNCAIRGLTSAMTQTPQASVETVCDGDCVYVASRLQGKFSIAAFDFDGHLRWDADIGPASDPTDRMTRPVLFESLIILCEGGPNRGIHQWIRSPYIVAVHRQTGKIVWRVKNPVAAGNVTLNVIP
ncbi:MAG: hypothetical protein FJ267_02260, partial [Planctomycetes bacterium]|nr:hypothetical protein [Planctomycetota bacterium]